MRTFDTTIEAQSYIQGFVGCDCIFLLKDANEDKLLKEFVIDKNKIMEYQKIKR